MSSLALLRVSARTDLPDIAAVGIIFLKLAGSSDTMQTVERRGGAAAHARPDGAELQLHRPEICAPAARVRVCACVRVWENKGAALRVLYQDPPSSRRPLFLFITKIGQEKQVYLPPFF